jgi:hypothetical protein
MPSFFARGGRIGLAQARSWPKPPCGTIRLKLLKFGASVGVAVRRIKVAMASACLSRNEFALARSGCATPSLDPNQTARRYMTASTMLPDRGARRYLARTRHCRPHAQPPGMLALTYPSA